MPTLTSLTVTPLWSRKAVTIVGDISVRESVALRLVGCGADTSIIFKMTSENGRVGYAQFPFAVGDEWTVDGDDLVATLNLNTNLLVAAFSSYGPSDRIGASVTVASVVNENLYASGCKQIGNWVEDTSDPVVYRTPILESLDAIDVRLEDLEGDFAAHTHDGADGGGGLVNHADLFGVGVTSHTAIDAALQSLTADINSQASNTASVLNRMNDLQEAVAAAAVSEAGTVDSATFGSVVTSLNSVLDWIVSVKAGVA